MGKRDEKMLIVAKQRTNSIRKTLEQQQEISQPEKSWLQKQKKAYQRSPNTFNKEKIALLDPLIPLLGYNWRYGHERVKIATTKNTKTIYNLLQQNKPLPIKESRWLYAQGINYKKNPKKFPKYKIKKLDKLIPLLGYDWRDGKNRLEKIKTDKIAEIRAVLQKEKPLSEELKRWLDYQQKNYEEYPMRFEPDHIASLDSLNSLLGYNWKKRYRVKELFGLEMIRRLSSALKSKRKIPKEVTLWINNQRSMYNNHPSTYFKQNKKQLDALIPLLGYDWKIKQREANTLSFSERIDQLKEKLQSSEKLSIKDTSWIGKYRRLYQKDPQHFSMDQKRLLDQLTPLLKRPWYTTTIPIYKKRKDFLKYLNEIKNQNAEYQYLSDKQKQWLQVERKHYLSAKDTYSKEKIKALNTLIPILGRDWKKYISKQQKSKTLEQRYREIKKKLNAQQKLDKKEKAWLQLQRRYFQKNKLSSLAIKKLDQLIPLLGYDWKKKLQEYAPHKTFGEHTLDIRTVLTAGGKLSKTQREYLRMQKAYYLRDPEKFSTYKLEILNDLIPLLKRDWKVRKIKETEVLSFEESLVKVRLCLIAGKELSNKQKKWLIKQRFDYKNIKPIMTIERITALDSLIGLLGYDWKSYITER
ncbi:hypothetical protein [Aquimarina longa]|uniref:hypothetical protein n=1 Tax=Aquimarina longa TaxID=1080221 RepID=UPI0007861050|nr:hypothetical protein [Aquimarina longa]